MVPLQHLVNGFKFHTENGQNYVMHVHQNVYVIVKINVYNASTPPTEFSKKQIHVAYVPNIVVTRVIFTVINVMFLANNVMEV